MKLCRHCRWSAVCVCFTCDEDTTILCLLRHKHVEKDDCCDMFEEEENTKQDKAFISDDYHTKYLGMHCNTHYDQWFHGYLLDIYRCLTSAGIRPRQIFLSKLEQDNYERELNK